MKELSKIEVFRIQEKIKKADIKDILDYFEGNYNNEKLVLVNPYEVYKNHFYFDADYNYYDDLKTEDFCIGIDFQVVLNREQIEKLITFLDKKKK